MFLYHVLTLIKIIKAFILYSFKGNNDNIITCFLCKLIRMIAFSNEFHSFDDTENNHNYFHLATLLNDIMNQEMNKYFVDK